MRLVRLDDPKTGGASLSFHRQITVVAGLAADARDWLKRAVRAIPRGLDPGCAGRIEVHGIELDLNIGNLELLQLRHGVDVVLEASDLPGAASSEPAAASSELEEARRRARAADDHYESILASAQEARRELEHLADERLQLERQLEAARSAMDSLASAAFQEATVKLAALERAETEIREGVNPAALSSDAKARRVELERQLAETRARLSRVGAVNVEGVRSAYAAFQLAINPSLLPSAEAVALADELAGITAALRTHQESCNHDDRIAGAMARRQAAADELAAAERELRVPELDPDLVEELETVRDQLVDLEHRVQRLGAGRSRRRVLQLHEQQDGLLRRLGFDSFASYLMGLGVSSRDLTEVHRRLQRAQGMVRTAEDQLARAIADRDSDLELADLMGRAEAVRVRGVAMLGNSGDGDLEGALRAHTVPSVRDAAEVAQAEKALVQQLLANGADLGTRVLDARGLDRVARLWLNDVDNLPQRRGALEEMASRIEAELRTLGRPDAGDANTGLGGSDRATPALPLESLQPQLAAARAEVAHARQRVSRHEEATHRLSEARAAEELLLGREAELKRIVGGADGMVEAASEVKRAALTELRRMESIEAATSRSAPDPGDARRDLDAVEWYVLTRLAQQRSVSFAGSMPLLIDDAFRGYPVPDLASVFERLDRMSDAIQIIYLTDDPQVVRWAFDLGERKAMVLDAAFVG